MKRKGIDFVSLLKDYKNGWVAISEDFRRVVFHGRTLKETMKKASKSDQKVYYFPADERYSHFFGIS